MGVLVATTRRQTGVTLAEMLIVVAVVAVAASLAIPKADPQAAFAADAAAGEIARALRFAQREAIRTGTYQQVSVDPATQVLRVYQPATSGSTTTAHPVDKRDYQISFAANAMPRATIVSAVFKYEGGPTTNFASFGPDGAPSYVDTSKLSQLWTLLSGTKDVDPLKEDGLITIRYGNIERVVRVAPVTGRVTL
ncbi:pilus assembly FimT family protein [Massilia suwonensis]|uniref:Tfp pilus assembly protein FimT/FimU n=1 Tax=Massilia suwonensis TaxID=648895 RepID=A0ABW0MKC1_9BURK